MPYKHIAARLQKTELACRLHYHQLSFGTKRRRRTTSVSSTRSTEQLPLPALNKVPEKSPQQYLPALSPPYSPESRDTVSDMAFKLPQNHIPILPKPVTPSQRIMQQSHALRLITQDIERFNDRSRIDKERLRRVYEAHRSEFWAAVARDYGDNASPAMLEDTWRQSLMPSNSNYPPTPGSSPQFGSVTPSTTIISHFSATSDMSSTNSFSPINMPSAVVAVTSAPSRNSFAISSLLTEDKEVRSPQQEKRLEDCEMKLN